MIYPKEQLKNIIRIEDSSPWLRAKRGWRAEVVNQDSGLDEFTFSAIEADIAKDMEYECCSDEEGLLLRVCLEGSGTISTAGVHRITFLTWLLRDRLLLLARLIVFIRRDDSASLILDLRPRFLGQFLEVIRKILGQAYYQ